MADTKKYLHNLDVENNKVMNLLLNPLTTAQRTAVGTSLGILDQGYVCYDTTLNIQFFWDGTQWIASGGGGGSQNLQQVTAIGDTVSNIAGDCVSQLQFDRYDIFDNSASSAIGFYVNYGGGNPYFYIQNGGSLTATHFGADSINVGMNSFYFPTSGTGTFAMSVNGVAAAADGSITIPVGTGTVTGSGTINYITKWTPSGTALGNSSIQDSSTGILANNSITAVGNVAKSINLTSTLIASANSDLLSALDINTTFTSGVFTGLTKRLFRATANTILRTELRDSGIQSWYLNDGSSEVGQIGYGTPSGHPGIVMFNASLTGRSDIRHMTNGGFTIATHTLGTPPPVDQFYFNPSGNFGIGTSNDVYRLEVVNTATPSANYARFANDNSNKNAILFSTSTSSAISLLGPSAERKLLIGNGGVGRADFITYTDNYFNFSYSNALGGAQNPASLITFTPNFSYSTGTNSHTILNLFPNISVTGGTNTLRGVYYNPNNTLGTVTTEIAWENTQGDIIHGNLATGGADQMVTVDSVGKLKKQTIPTGGGGGIPHATASGTDTYTTTVTGVTSYTDGDAYIIQFTNGNTTSCTLNINGLGAIPLYRNNDGALIGGDIVDGGEMICVYDSTTNIFRCIGTAPNTLLAYVTNDDSVTITKGQPVYAFGGTGDRMTVKLAYNTSDATSAQTVGLVFSASIAPNAKGIIMMQGLLDGLSNVKPVNGWSDGSPVYLGSTAGAITPTKQYAPNHLVYLGVVTTASPGSAGRMYVKVQNGYELDELHNVQAQTPSLNDTLYYDSAVSPAQWKTASIATILGYTPLQRSVNVVSTATSAGSAAATDYVYLVSGTTTITLPTAVGNTNRYTIKNSGTGIVSIATTSSQTIDDSTAPITINTQYVSLDLISDGSNWEII